MPLASDGCSHLSPTHRISPAQRVYSIRDGLIRPRTLTTAPFLLLRRHGADPRRSPLHYSRRYAGAGTFSVALAGSTAAVMRQQSGFEDEIIGEKGQPLFNFIRATETGACALRYRYLSRSTARVPCAACRSVRRAARLSRAARRPLRWRAFDLLCFDCFVCLARGAAVVACDDWIGSTECLRLRLGSRFMTDHYSAPSDASRAARLLSHCRSSLRSGRGRGHARAHTHVHTRTHTYTHAHTHTHCAAWRGDLAGRRARALP